MRQWASAEKKTSFPKPRWVGQRSKRRWIKNLHKFVPHSAVNQGHGVVSVRLAFILQGERRCGNLNLLSSPIFVVRGGKLQVLTGTISCCCSENPSVCIWSGKLRPLSTPSRFFLNHLAGNWTILCGHLMVLTTPIVWFHLTTPTVGDGDGNKTKLTIAAS